MKSQRKRLNKEFRRLSRHPVFWIVTFVRLAGALLILRNPWTGWLTYVLLDILDNRFLVYGAGMSSLSYHVWDKYIDTGVYVVMLWVGLHTDASVALIVLFVYRLIGQFLFWRTLKEEILIIFPNLFEAVWVFVVVGRWLHVTDHLTKSELGVLWYTLFMVKMGQEVFVHYIGPRWVFPWVRHTIGRVFPWYDRPN